MAMLCFLGVWLVYLWLARTCLRRSAAVTAGHGAVSRVAASPPRVRVPDTVPVEWIEAYRTENGA
jgi:hypothetical protein